MKRLRVKEDEGWISPPVVSREMGYPLTHFKLNQALLIPQGGLSQADRRVIGGQSVIPAIMSCLGVIQTDC